MKIRVYEGGKGSGNFDHKGRSGEVGGSSPGYSDLEISGVLSYSSLDGKKINQALRYGTGEWSGIITQLDSAIRKSSLPEDEVLYRIMGAGYYPIKPGEIFTDKAFVSATLVREKLEAMAVLGPKTIPIEVRIMVKKGQKGLVTQPNMVIYPDEKEVILPRNSKFRVISYDPSTFVQYSWGQKERPILVVELLNENSFS